MDWLNCYCIPKSAQLLLHTEINSIVIALRNQNLWLDIWFHDKFFNQNGLFFENDKGSFIIYVSAIKDRSKIFTKV